MTKTTTTTNHSFFESQSSAVWACWILWKLPFTNKGTNITNMYRNHCERERKTEKNVQTRQKAINQERCQYTLYYEWPQTICVLHTDVGRVCMRKSISVKNRWRKKIHLKFPGKIANGSPYCVCVCRCVWHQLYVLLWLLLSQIIMYLCRRR